ncbi:MAG: hypothetical protein JOY61_00535 [Chloroflexi bacterium]|nr:hypothetical protein [Chloroflexota bacterium]
MTREEFTAELARFRQMLARWSEGRNSREERWYLNALSVSLSAVELETRGAPAHAAQLWPVLSAMWANRPMTEQERAELEEARRKVAGNL